MIQILDGLKVDPKSVLSKQNLYSLYRKKCCSQTKMYLNVSYMDNFKLLVALNKRLNPEFNMKTRKYLIILIIQTALAKKRKKKKREREKEDQSE